jgi:hypothetical protein
MPNGGIATYLKRAGFDVWLLDYRGSPKVLPDYLDAVKKKDPFQGNVYEECQFFTYDEIARVDVDAALRHVRQTIGEATPLSFVGHCVGGGIAAMDIATGIFDEFNVRNVVLIALGLFYEVPWDGWIKVEDYILERILAQDKACRSLDPKDRPSWPRVMRDAYESWPRAWLARGERSIDELLRGLTFMVGKPWNPEFLEDGLNSPILEPVFGPMHLGTYLHCGQLVRRGYAAPYEEVDFVDRSRLGRKARSFSAGPAKDYLNPKSFLEKNITLITGSENRVWHRDAIDLMYEWLRGLDGRDVARYKKHVVPNFGLQDLFWRKGARDLVWPHVKSGLAGVDQVRETAFEI